MSDKYAEKQKAKEKLDAAEEKKQKKLQAKMDKIESKQGGDQDSKRRQQNDRDENEALKELNSVFKEFPEYTLVARNTLGDDDAEYIYNNLLQSETGPSRQTQEGETFHTVSGHVYEPLGLLF